MVNPILACAHGRVLLPGKRATNAHNMPGVDGQTLSVGVEAQSFCDTKNVPRCPRLKRCILGFLPTITSCMNSFHVQARSITCSTMKRQGARSTFLLLLLVFLFLSAPTFALNKRNAKKAVVDTDEALDTEHLTVAGQLAPFVSKFAPSQAKIQAVARALSDAINVKEFVVLNVIGWASVPFFSTLYDVYINIADRMTSDTNVTEVDFTDTYFYHAVQDIAHVAQIGVLVYLFDCLAITLNALGFSHTTTGLSKKVAQISYTIWAGLRLARVKHALLKRYFAKKLDALGRTKLWNRILNVVISVTTGAIVFDFMDLDFGTALKSLLSFGGVGALIFSLSSKDLATQLVSGLVVSTSDQFLEGDEIELGDGQAGIIERMGIAYTDLRGYDEITTRIPNSLLSNQRVRNLSRVTRSQVKQTLWFSYKDIDKIPAVCEAILREIQETCGESVITDGSRPFRAHWRDFKDDHLEVVVDTHFNVKAATSAYWDNRQKVLESIARAVEKMGLEFTLPSFICNSGEGEASAAAKRERRYA